MLILGYRRNLESENEITIQYVSVVMSYSLTISLQSVQSGARLLVDLPRPLQSDIEACDFRIN
jgi:hypothetical protein